MQKRVWSVCLIFLSLFTITIWLAVLYNPRQNFQIIACDVGQGDAILVTKGKSQIITDGGPNDKVISCLSRHIPFWDRRIELMVLTHPQKDHLDGLIDILRYYDVDNILLTDYNNQTEGYELFKNLAVAENAKLINAYRGIELSIGEIKIEVLNPEPNNRQFVLGAVNTDEDLNIFSVVTSISYGSFDALLTGDIDPKLSDHIAERLEKDYEYLKVPHHGSKNGLSEKLLINTRAEVAVISVGSENRFGHPHAEIMQMLEKNNINTYRTDQMGDVIIESDGVNYWLKK